MLHHLPNKDDEGGKVHLVRNLLELFKQIDYNNDGSLEWDEFTKHLIELGKCLIFRIFSVFAQKIK